MSQPIEFTPGNVKDATKGLKSSDLWQVPFEQLYIMPGFNVREPRADLDAHVETLANLIEVNGYDRDQPMSGYVASIDGASRIVITNGHNRYAALELLRARGVEIESVPVITKTRGTSMEDLTIALATSNSGKPLSPYEIGTVCKRLQGFGRSEEGIAQALGITTTYVTDLLFLHSCPKAIRDLVRTDKVAAGLAISTVRKHGDKALAILKGAVDTAEASGKKKATAKDLPPSWAKEVKKAGAKLYEAVMWIKEDAAYKKLTPATREFLDEILASLPPEPAKPEAQE